jgi:hypothetical protein
MSNEIDSNDTNSHGADAEDPGDVEPTDFLDRYLDRVSEEGESSGDVELEDSVEESSGDVVVFETVIEAGADVIETLDIDLKELSSDEPVFDEEAFKEDFGRQARDMKNDLFSSSRGLMRSIGARRSEVKGILEGYFNDIAELEMELITSESEDDRDYYSGEIDVVLKSIATRLSTEKIVASLSSGNRIASLIRNGVEVLFSGMGTVVKLVGPALIKGALAAI